MAYVSVLPGSTRYPKVKLEWAPTATPLTTPAFGDAAWIDITSRWRGLEWSYGRNDELGSYESGRGYVLLANADRAFDPSYTSGTWYGNLKPRRPFQFTFANQGGTAYGNLVFYATGFPQSWPGDGTDAVAQVDLVDLMTVAQTIEFPIGYTRPQEGAGDRFIAVANDFSILPWSATSAGTLVAALNVQEAGQSVLSHLRQVVESEGGGLFQGLGGYLYFRSKRTMITLGADTAQRLNVTDEWAGHASAIRYTTDFTTVQDDNYLFNASTFTGEGGAIGSSFATSSANEFGRITKSFGSLLALSTDCEDMAQYFTYLHSQPVMRAPTVTVDLASSSTTAQGDILSSDLGKACRITRYAATLDPLVMDQKVEGIAHHVRPGQYTMTFATSPADLSSYWTLETSTLGTINSTNVIAP